MEGDETETQITLPAHDFEQVKQTIDGLLNPLHTVRYSENTDTPPYVSGTSKPLPSYKVKRSIPLFTSQQAQKLLRAAYVH